MSYAKPVVTIDLAEYNELIEYKNRHDSDDNLLMAKKVICAFINSSYGSVPADFNRFMASSGVALKIKIDRDNNLLVMPNEITIIPLKTPHP